MALVLGTSSGFVTTAPTADPGGGDTVIDGSSIVTKDTSPSNAVKITEIGWYRGIGTNTANFEVALYADGSGIATTRLYVDATNSSSTQGWITVTVDWDIDPSTPYWLSVQMDAHTGSSDIDNATSGGSGSDVRTGQSTLADPYGGGAVADADGMYAVYALIETNDPPTTVLNTPADAGTVSDTTPTLDFTGTDVDGDSIRYNVQIDTVNTFDSQTPSTASVIVEAWGAGGGGQGSNNSTLTQGRGGGGGAFARDNSVTVSNSTGYAIGVGTGGSGGSAGNPPGAGSNGGNSTFDTTTVVAMGGLSGGNGGTGGTTAGSTGDDEYAGGNGSPGSGISSGGAGGGGAGSGGNGGNASGTTGGSAGTPDGGAGANTTGNPSVPGGGGKNPDWTSAGQAGANGQVRVKALLGVVASATGGTHSADGTYDYWTFSSSGTWTPTLVGGPLIDVVSGTDSGFANPDTGGDTDPFNSGENIQFTVQGGDALAADTYYWRVRGIDPSGSNAYGSWATTRSFTITSGGAIKDLISSGFIAFVR